MIDYILQLIDFINLNTMPVLNWIVFALEILYILIKFSLIIFPANSKIGKFLRKLFVGYKALRTKIEELEAQNKIKDNIIKGDLENGKSDTAADNADTAADNADTAADNADTAADNAHARRSNATTRQYVEQLKHNSKSTRK